MEKGIFPSLSRSFARSRCTFFTFDNEKKKENQSCAYFFDALHCSTQPHRLNIFQPQNLNLNVNSIGSFISNSKQTVLILICKIVTFCVRCAATFVCVQSVYPLLLLYSFVHSVIKFLFRSFAHSFRNSMCIFIFISLSFRFVSFRFPL